MRSKLHYLVVISVLFFLMFGGIMITLVSNMINQGEGGTITDYPLDTRASTEPGNPVTLQKDTPILESSIPNQTVYYKTQTASNSQFQVVWQNCISGHSLLLQLYPDSTYTGLLLQHSILIAKPDTSRIMYVGCDPQTPETSSAYIGWEEATILTSGGVVTGILSDAEYLDAYEVSLDRTSHYDFALTVPAGTDYNMVIYITNYSSSGYTLAIPWKSNITDVDGMDEIITNWNPDVTGVYIVIIAWEAGVGTYSLTFNCTDCPIPINPAMIFIGLFIGILIYVRKGKKITA